MSYTPNQPAGNRFFKLIDGSNIFGETESVFVTEEVTELLIKQPYTAKNGNVMPYMADEMGSSPKAVQIHPMNVLWSVPLDEFSEANELYKKATSQIITPESNIII